jgi:hypothetical protein
MIKNTYSILVLLLLLTSCSKRLVPFSQKIYETYNWTDSDLKNIQFYLSDDIVLRRTLGMNESTIREGRIVIIDGQEVEEVIFKKGTPGVYIFSPKENRFGVSFENNDESYLMFGPNPKKGERYVLLAKEWERNRGKVSYKGKLYETTTASGYATLMVDLNKASRIKYKTTTVSGRKVNG